MKVEFDSFVSGINSYTSKQSGELITYAYLSSGDRPLSARVTCDSSQLQPFYRYHFTGDLNFYGEKAVLSVCSYKIIK